MGSEPMGMKLW